MSFLHNSEKKIIVQVAIDSPVNKLFDYRWNELELKGRPQRGQVVAVNFARKDCVGVVININDETEHDLNKLKDVQSIAPINPLGEDLLAMSEFAAVYYQRPLGEVLLPAIPKQWRQKNKWELLSKERKNKKTLKVKDAPTKEIVLNSEQQEIVNELVDRTVNQKYSCNLLQGVTGSGKTLTYLRWLDKVLEVPGAQALIMVPEINLTPQMESAIQAAFPDKKVAVLHSGLTDRSRADHWLSAHTGEASIILGTRMAIMASMPNLKAIVVDEEHDLSYKQQEGVRYSARDLAVWRAKKIGIPVLLVSATPSLETWFHAQEARYQKLTLSNRAAKDSEPPIIELVDMKQDKKTATQNDHGFSAYLLDSLQKNLDLGLQSLVYINRRGYSPVISCEACGWVSGCQKCSAHMVLHKISDYKKNLCCHHCGLIKQIPKTCPECGNADLQPVGKGTQKIEEFLVKTFPQAKILRIDADTTRKKGSADNLFGAVHDGEADIIVGTQMITKGHDYKAVSLVGVIDADASLFSQDYRASERLFAQLMQVAGRAGRSEKTGQSKVIIQTRYPNAAPYTYLKTNDVDGFLEELKGERELVGLPPFSYQALVHAEHKTLLAAIDMLKDAVKFSRADENWPLTVSLSDVIPRAMVRVAGKERAQVLIESSNRQSLQHAIQVMQHYLTEQNTKRKGVGWYIERDPVMI